MLTNSKITASILGALALIGVTRAQSTELLDLNVDETILSGVANILLLYFVLALVIERACEVVMDILTANGAVVGKDSTDQGTAPSERRAISMFICLLFAVVVSLAGLRLVESILGLAATNGFVPKPYFTTIDAFLTALILAGGSDGVHQIMTRILGEKTPEDASTEISN